VLSAQSAQSVKAFNINPSMLEVMSTYMLEWTLGTVALMD